MTKFAALRTAFLALLALGVFTNSASAKPRFRQPAYMSNMYFCDAIVKDAAGFPQPQKVINTILAEEEVNTHFVMNIWADKGTHKIEVDFLDVRAKKIGMKEFKPFTASGNDRPLIIGGRFGGIFPSGGLFLKVYDVFEGKRYPIGTYRIMTQKLSKAQKDAILGESGKPLGRPRGQTQPAASQKPARKSTLGSDVDDSDIGEPDFGDIPSGQSEDDFFGPKK